MAVDAAGLVQARRDEEAANLDMQTIYSAIQAKQLDMHTAIPGIVDKFDAEKQTAEVRPAIKMLYVPDKNAYKQDPQWIDRSLCVDVPVVFSGNADYLITHPVNKGDECLLVFSERCIDDWYSQGGTQQQAELRNHDASDAMAVMGLRSQPSVKNVKKFDTDNLQIRNAEGDCSVTLDKTGIVTIAVKDKTTVTVEDGVITGQVDGTMVTIEQGIITCEVDGTTLILTDGTATVKATAIKLDGKVEITGDVNIGGDLLGQGNADFIADVTAGEGSVSLQTHVHSGVQSGGSTTGPPV